ncbi:hypothetical protein M1V28_31420 (plasmid) [Pseudomonas aeruginosa]|uniref:hypothetical protein n=1 Tax=Pseudomonas aeruginosa TaxID=287 RepID=UPI0022DDF5BA|nr:hypothetical protein [Pseudomonas aeruginosa]WBM10916.1 hypothetical protein M1V28_31420 [Pseudomonas aeruginosa]
MSATNPNHLLPLPAYLIVGFLSVALGNFISTSLNEIQVAVAAFFCLFMLRDIESGRARPNFLFTALFIILGSVVAAGWSGLWLLGPGFMFLTWLEGQSS